MQQTCFPSQSLFSDLVDLNVCVTVGSILQNSSLPSFLPSVSVHNNTCEQKTARLSLLCIIVSAIRMTNWQYRWGLISSYSLKGILCHNSFNKEISTLPHIKASYQHCLISRPRSFLPSFCRWTQLQFTLPKSHCVELAPEIKFADLPQI